MTRFASRSLILYILNRWFTVSTATAIETRGKIQRYQLYDAGCETRAPIPNRWQCNPSITTSSFYSLRFSQYGVKRNIKDNSQRYSPSIHCSSCKFWLLVIHAALLCGGNALLRGAGKSLARPGKKQATATENLMFIYPIYNHNWTNISTIYIYNKTSIKRNILTIKQNTSRSWSG
jgi:hypothetical protein